MKKHIRLKKIILTFITATILCFCVYAEISVPEVEEFISIKYTEPFGIRAVASLPRHMADDESTNEYGFIATRLALLDIYGVHAADFSIDSGVPMKRGLSKGIADGEKVDKFFYKDEEILKYSGAFFGIDENRRYDLIVIRPYAIYNDEIVYGKSVMTDLYDEARNIMNADGFKELFPEAKSAVEEIVAGVEQNFERPEKNKRIVKETSVELDKNGYYRNKYVLYVPDSEKTEEYFGNRVYLNKSDVKTYAKEGFSVTLVGKYVEDRFFNSAVDEKLCEMLNRAYTKLKSPRISNKLHKEARDIIVDCLWLVLNDAKAGIPVDRDYVTDTYSFYIDSAENTINNKMDVETRSDFGNFVKEKLDDDVEVFILSYFGISLDELEQNK